jgi:hypothetical protein
MQIYYYDFVDIIILVYSYKANKNDVAFRQLLVFKYLGIIS